MNVGNKLQQDKPAKEAFATTTQAANQVSALTVKRIRGILGRTQTELATAIGVSAKAVQSYEQGWRKVPARAMIQILVLLALYRKHAVNDSPCWKIRKCPPAQRKKCISFTVGQGKFCWFISSKNCHPASGPGHSAAVIPCMECPVIQRLLNDKPSQPLH